MTNRLSVCIFSLGLSACAYQPQQYVAVDTNAVKPGDLYGRFLGTTNLYLSDGHDAVMIDAYFTRQGQFSTFIHNVHSDPKVVAETLSLAGITQINRLLVSHSHFDHALDAGTVASIHPTMVLNGSAQTAELFENVELIPLNKPIPQGAFTITAIESPHIEKTASQRWFESLINKWAGGDTYANAGTVYSFHLAHPEANILVIPSARYTESFHGLQADVVLGIQTT